MRKITVFSAAMCLALLVGAGVRAQEATSTAYAASGNAIYSLDDLSSPSNRTKLASVGQQGYYTIEAGTVIEGKYYAMVYDESECTYSLRAFGLADGAESTVMEEVLSSRASTDMTYSADDNTIYGVNTYYIVKYDLESGTASNVMNHMPAKLGVAAKDGYLYMITKSANSDTNFGLYRLPVANLVKANLEKVFDLTEFKSVSSGSLEFDTDGKLYWLGGVVYPEETFASYHVFAIDIEQQTLTKLADLSEALSGLAFGTATQGGGDEPDDPDAPVVLTTRIDHYGDPQGQISDDQPVTIDYYYYTANNRLAYWFVAGYSSGTSEYGLEQGYSGKYQYVYNYNYNYNEDGQLMSVVRYQRGMYAGYDIVWGNPTVVEEYTYDENGNVATFKDVSYKTEYKWEGKNLIWEKQITNNGSWTYTHWYSDFVEGFDNLPQTMVSNGTYSNNQHVVSMTYDEKGNMLTRTQNGLDEIIVNEDDETVMPYYTTKTPSSSKTKETWTYEEGRLTFYERFKYKSADSDYTTPDYKTTYTLQEDGGVKVYGQSYDNILKKWSTPATWTVEYESEYLKGSALDNFALEVVEGDKPNTVKLSADAPVQSVGNPSWNLYRDGELVGQLTSDGEGRLTCTDEEVENGTHYYFVQCEDETSDYAMYITPVITHEFDTELPAITEFTVVKNEIVDSNYVLEISWNAPSDYTILGYVVYDRSDKNNDTGANWEPEFTGYITETTYSWSWSTQLEQLNRSFAVETIYKMGRVMSAVNTVTLNGNASGIESDEVSGMMQVEGDLIRVNGDYNTLSVYGVNGALAGQYRNTETVDISGLAAGVYVVRLDCAEGLKTVKLIKK